MGVVDDPVRLTAREERALLVATEAGDPAACSSLVDAFLPAISAQASHFPAGGGVLREELLHEGVVGLLTAARHYDVTRNVPFWGYASFWVRKAMQRLVAELAHPVALSDRAIRDLAAVADARDEHVQGHGVEPTYDELGHATGLRPSQLHDLAAAARTSRSLDDPLTSRDPAEVVTLGDLIPDATAEKDFDAVLDTLERRELRDLAETLGERERTVVLAHFGIGMPPRTLQQIGTTLGVTAERARQIEVRALDQLRDAWVSGGRIEES
jgi:RNA polymerase sigma factor (sigma-70 family)